MNYRQPLFQIERLSPRLAKKIRGLLVPEMRLTHLSDKSVEVQISSGQNSASPFIAAAELASRSLWQKHVPFFESLFLESVQAEFLKTSYQVAYVRAELTENERESILRKLNNGETVHHEMALSLIDEKKQSMGQVTCTWRLKLKNAQPLLRGAD